MGAAERQDVAASFDSRSERSIGEQILLYRRMDFTSRRARSKEVAKSWCVGSPTFNRQPRPQRRRNVFRGAAVVSYYAEWLEDYGVNMSRLAVRFAELKARREKAA